jgi:hypothetical protein
MNSLPTVEQNILKPIPIDWKPVYFSSNLIMWTKFPELFIPDKSGFGTIIKDPKARFDISKMTKEQKAEGIILRVGRKFVKIIFRR